jgi:hypothetical protein
MPGNTNRFGKSRRRPAYRQSIAAYWYEPCGGGERVAQSPHRALSSMGKYGGIKPYTKLQVTECQGRIAGDRLASCPELTSITMVLNRQMRNPIL